MAVIELDYAQRWIQNFAADPRDACTILDSDGVVIARTPLIPGVLGRRIKARAGQTSFGMRNDTSFIARSPLDDTERIFGLSRLERFPFTTVVGYDKSYALHAWRQRAWQFGFGYLVLVIVSFALLRAYLRSVDQRRDLHTLANTDELTGIANRRHLFERGEQEVTRALRYEKPLSVLMMDIDLFKKINDLWGHPSGDKVIRHTADLLKDVLRTVDAYGRIGGEEFCAILPETDIRNAWIVAERLRIVVESTESIHASDGQPVRYTISIGISTLLPEDSSFVDVLSRADQALYRAKDLGRNRVLAV